MIGTIALTTKETIPVMAILPKVSASIPSTNLARLPPGMAELAREMMALAAWMPEQPTVVAPLTRTVRVAALVIVSME